MRYVSLIRNVFWLRVGKKENYVFNYPVVIMATADSYRFLNEMFLAFLLQSIPLIAGNERRKDTHMHIHITEKSNLSRFRS